MKEPESCRNVRGDKKQTQSKFQPAIKLGSDHQEDAKKEDDQEKCENSLKICQNQSAQNHTGGDHKNREQHDCTLVCSLKEHHALDKIRSVLWLLRSPSPFYSRTRLCNEAPDRQLDVLRYHRQKAALVPCDGVPCHTESFSEFALS